MIFERSGFEVHKSGLKKSMYQYLLTRYVSLYICMYIEQQMLSVRYIYTVIVIKLLL